MLHHLKPTGRAGIMLANGAVSSSQNSEGDIRRAMGDAAQVNVQPTQSGDNLYNSPSCP